MDKITSRTERALVARGLDSSTAHQLRKAGHTATSLLQNSPDILRGFGVNETIISSFYKGGRPAIPPQTLLDVLFANRWTCCVCRNVERPIIVHHINEWATSRDHSAGNLAVLCPLHHGEAHTVRGLELSLNGDRIRGFKARWEKHCESEDLTVTLNKSEHRLNTWYYFNHLRIYELARELNINLRMLPGYSDLRDFQSCNDAGVILKAIPDDGYMYRDADRHALYNYVSEMFFRVLKKLGVLNISDYLDRGFISQHVIVGRLVIVQGLHRFTPVSQSRSERNVREVWRQSNKVKVSGIINTGEATSDSSRVVWLSGQHNLASVIKVRSITREDGVTHIRGTVLAIRDQDDDIKRRNYAQRAYETGFRFREDYDDSDIEDGEPWDFEGSTPETF
jgi:hypothetical protein